MKHTWILGLAVVILALAAIPAVAQPVVSAKSGTIAYIEGNVFLDEQPVEVSVSHFPNIQEKSVVRTEEGRAEILLTPGVTLRLGEKGSLRMITNRLIDTRLELTGGSAVVVADSIQPDNNVTIACKEAVITISKVGVYRFDAEPARVKVFKGTATVAVGGQNIQVASGKMLSLDGGTAAAQKFDLEDTDSLDHWSNLRSGYMAMANVSAAKMVHDNYGGYSGSASSGLGSWAWNPYFGMYTFIPGGNGRYCNSFYGYCYWSPTAVYGAYYAPTSAWWNNGGYSSNNTGYSYPTSVGTSNGYSGTVASTSSMGTAVGSAAGATSAASAGASSVGHGSASGSSAGSGGHGR